MASVTLRYRSAHNPSGLIFTKDPPPLVLQATHLAPLSADGYIFEGWYYSESYTRQAVVGESLYQDTILYAKWSVDTTRKTISYSTEHGTTPQSKMVSVGYSLTSADLPTLSQEGYTFKGWYLNQEKTQKAEVGYQITQNTTLYAKWEAKPLISYSTSHGSRQSKYVDVGYTLTSEDISPLTAEGYRFDGWFRSSSYTQPAEVGFAVTQDLTLYAKWTQVITRSVNYSTQFGSVATKYIEDGETLTSDYLPTLSQEGYAFGGWYRDSSYQTPALGTTVASNITVYAKWTEVSTSHLYVGNDRIAKAYLGGNAVKIYIGNTRII